MRLAALALLAATAFATAPLATQAATTSPSATATKAASTATPTSAAATAPAASAKPALDCDGTDLDFTQKRLLGTPENLCQKYGGKVVLAVNVASHCGYTPQYEGLEKLYRQYKDQGLVVLGFPSADFGGQEFDDEQDIAKFCKANYGVSFPIFGKSTVKGADATPLYQRLAKATGEAPKWNFNKYLIGRDGKVVAHYGSKVAPGAEELTAAIEKALEKKGS